MSRIFHVWWLVIVAIIVIALILIWALYSGSQSLSANSLYDAVNSSAMYAREKGSRMDRGTFVINRNLFQKRLSEYKIKGYGKVGSDSAQPSSMYIHYLPDNSKTDNNSKYGTTINNERRLLDGYIGASHYKDTDPTNIKDDLPIRAIQVSASSVNHHQSDNDSSVSNTKDKYVATDVVQVSDKDSNIDNNTPIRNPNNTDRDSDDPTVNSFIGTNGSEGSTNNKSVDASGDATSGNAY